jgi:hypothetical protein
MSAVNWGATDVHAWDGNSNRYEWGIRRGGFDLIV